MSFWKKVSDALEINTPKVPSFPGLVHDGKRRSILPSKGKNPAVDEADSDHEETVVAKSAIIKPNKTEQEFLNDLDERFFTEHFDAVRFSLMQLPDPVVEGAEEEGDDIEIDATPVGEGKRAAIAMDTTVMDAHSNLDTIKSIIERKLATILKDNYPQFFQRMEAIYDIKFDLHMSGKHCRHARRKLQLVHASAIKDTLQVLQIRRRRARLLEVRRVVAGITKLHATTKQIELFLEQRDYARCVRAHSECMAEIASYQQFACVSSMTAKLLALRDQIKQTLRDELLGFCMEFNLEPFVKVISAFIALGQAYMHTLPNTLTQYFLTSVDKVSQQTLIQSIMGYNDSVQNTQANLLVPGKSFKQLCPLVHTSTFKDCYLSLVHSLVSLLFSSYTMSQVLLCCAHVHYTARVERKEPIQVCMVSGSTAVPAQATPGRSVQNSDPAEDVQLALGSLVSVLETREVAGEQWVRHEVGWSLQANLKPLEDPFTTAAGQARLAAVNPAFKASVAQYVNVEEGLFSPANLQYLYICSTKLETDKQKIWFASQRRATDLLSSVHPTTSTIPLDEFLKILSSGYRFIAIGGFYSGTSSDRHVSSILDKSREYVANVHKNNFENLKQTLQLERWVIMQLQPTFDLNSMRELRFEEIIQSTAEEDEEGEDAHEKRIFELFLRGENCFDDHADKKKLLSAAAAAANDDQDNKQGASDANPNAYAAVKVQDEAANRPAYVITSSAILVARTMGKYVRIMRDLRPLALNALNYTHEMFDCYLYTIFSLFGVSSYRFFTDEFHLYRYLRMAVKSVRERFESGKFASGVFQQQRQVAAPVELVKKKKKKESLFSQLSNKTKSKPKPLANNKSSQPAIPMLVRLNSTVNVTQRSNLFGLVERIAATESLDFIVKVIVHCQPQMKALLPRDERHKVTDFVTYASSVAQEFSRYMFRNLAPFMLPIDMVLQKMMSVAWDVHEIQTKANDYVDVILSQLDMSLQIIASKEGKLPEETVMKRLWKETLDYLTEKLVDGYSKITKCTSEGRSWMIVDLRALKSGLEKLTGLEPLPHWDYVNEYVVAYYYGQEDFLQWVLDHTQYTLSQYLSIASVGACAKMTKKDKKVFFDRVEEAHKKNIERKAKERMGQSSDPAFAPETKTAENTSSKGESAASSNTNSSSSSGSSSKPAASETKTKPAQPGGS